MELTEKKVISKLEDMIGSRHDSLNELSTHLNDVLGTPCEIAEQTRYDDDDDDEFRGDFIILGNINTVDVYCDFDLYYINDNSGRIYITAISHKFE